MLGTSQFKRWAAAGEPETPYARAGAEWDSRMGSARQQAASWRFFALACLALCGVCILGLAYLGTLPKQAVHIVEVNPEGEATYRGIAGAAWAEWDPTEQQRAFQLRRFLRYTRGLSSDPMVTRRNWLDAYTLLAGEAISILNNEANAQNPFERAATERVTVTIESVLRLSADTWQAEWQEDIWSSKGVPIGTERWRGTFKLQRLPPTTPERIQQNPLGLYVTHFSWSMIEG